MGKILIADSSEEFRELLARELEQHHQVNCCADGQRALEILEEFTPDLMVLDLMLVGDGMALLQTAAERGICPRTVVSTSFFSPYMSELLNAYPVEYVFRKPCSISAVKNRVLDLAGRQQEPVLQLQSNHAAVTTMLHELGIPTNYSGFDQIRLGVLMLADNPGLQMTKVVYPGIAEMSIHGGNKDTVERNIRSAIATAYNRRDDRVWRRYFPAAPNGQIPKPTNAKFLTGLAEMLTSGVVRKAK